MKVQRKAKTVLYTVRGVPSEVDQVLRKKAAQSGQSLNQLIVDELTRATLGPSAPI